MSQRIRTLICMVLIFCVAAAAIPAFAAGGHAYETAVPPGMQTEETPDQQTNAEPEADLSDFLVTDETEDSRQEARAGTPAQQTLQKDKAVDSTPVGAPAKTNSQPKDEIIQGTENEASAVTQPLDQTEPDQPAETEETGETGQPSDAAQPAEAEQQTETASAARDAQGSNFNDSYQLNLPTGEEQTDPGAYLFALHTRPEAYNPASVLISGVLYAPAETEILEATVTTGNGGTYTIPASDIIRISCGSDPASASALTFEPDRDRSAFAFLVDLSEEGLPDGAVELTVTLTTDRLLTLSTTAMLNAALGQYYHVTRAVREQCLKLDDQDQEDRHVTRFQQKLADLGYLTENDLSGIFDEKTMAAARKVLDRYDRNAGNETLNPEEVGFILSDQPEPKPEEEEGLPGKALGFFRNTVHLFGRDIPVWILTAAGAALLLIILIVILLITGRKKKARRREKEASTMSELSRRSAFITGQEESEQAQQILTIGDEPTMDLAEAEAGGGLVYSGDEPTTDLDTQLYTVKLRLIYSGQYMDTEVRLQDNGEAVIGRGEGVQIQTNPADTSVSHRHGLFNVKNGLVTYTDNSRNGTRYNGQRMLHKGESVNIPFNTKVQIDVGNHKVLVITVKK